MNLKAKAEPRAVTEVGPGDYIRVNAGLIRCWKLISYNTAHGLARAPRAWSIETSDGQLYGMFDIFAYAKAEDME